MMSERKKWKKPMWLKKVEYAILMLGVKIMQSLEVNTCYALANKIGLLVYYCDFKHRNRAISHILHSGIRTDLAGAKELAKKNFQHILKVFVDVVTASRLVTRENFRDYYELDMEADPEWLAFSTSEKNENVILATGHLGNWELAGSAYSLLSGIPLVSIMRPLENELIGNFFYSRRAVFDHTTFSKEKGVRPLLTALLHGESIAIVADQHAVRQEGVEIEFCGHPARAHMTPALLNLKTKVKLICWVAIRKEYDFKFKITGCGPVHYTPTGDKEKDIQALAQLYSNQIEECLRKYPEQWLWPHRRWLDCNRKHNKEKNS